MDKINCILLVDDDPTTNFLNEELIYDLDIAEQVFVAYNGQEALDFLNNVGKFESKKGKKHPRPNIIFLDINMPLMDGFEFLEQYKKIHLSKKADVVIVFLTTSDSYKDRIAVDDDTLVFDFIEKPLRKGKLLEIRNEYIDKYK